MIINKNVHYFGKSTSLITCTIPFPVSIDPTIGDPFTKTWSPFLVIFIFAYTTTKSEFEQKVYYKIERVAILLERQLEDTNIQTFEGDYIIGEINSKIKIN